MVDVISNSIERKTVTEAQVVHVNIGEDGRPKPIPLVLVAATAEPLISLAFAATGDVVLRHGSHCDHRRPKRQEIVHRQLEG